jgi:hypothetical protein
MGQLSLTVAGVTATIPFDDAAGAVVLADFVAAYSGPVEGTAQQRLDFAANKIVAHVQAVHAGYVRDQAAVQARADADANMEVLQ